MKMNGLKAFVAVNVVSTVTHRSHAFSPSSLSFLAKSRNQITSSFDHLLPWNAHDKKHTQEKGVDPKNTIDPRASKESVLSTIEKETELRNKCIAFGLQAKNGLSGKNVTVAWSEYTNLTGSWWLNDTMSLEKVVHDFNKSVLTNSSSSSSSSPSESSSISIDNRPAVQENGRKQLVMKIIDAFIRAKKVENRLFTVTTEDENFFFRSTLDKEKRVFLSKEGDEISTDIIEYVQCTGLNDGKVSCDLENDDEVSSWLTKVLGADWKSPQEQKKDLLAELEKAFEKDNIGFFDYIPHLVDVEYPGGLKDFQFETLRERSSCLCVAGESGAGKTSFVQNHVRQNVLMDDKKFDAALYIALDKDSTNGFNTTHSRSEEETKLYTIIQDTRDLIDKNGTAIDDKLGNIQTYLFENRD